MFVVEIIKSCLKQKVLQLFLVQIFVMLQICLWYASTELYVRHRVKDALIEKEPAYNIM